jgi:membrane protease YdiL (CAAX protease family)
LAPFLAYVGAFHLVWSAWPYFVYPRLTAVGTTTLAYALLNLGIRLLVWVIPVLLYLRYVDRVEPLGYLKLTHHVRRGMAVAIVLTALNWLGTTARFGPPHLSMARVTWNSVLGTSLLVGFVEEIPYRGFMLQKFAEHVDFWLANLITSLLFLAVHLPGWMALHTLSAETAATVFIFGAIMGMTFRYSDSLWAPIVAHSANDFLSFVLFGR